MKLLPLKVKNVIDVIQYEITWAEQTWHEDESFKRGFILGLKQVIVLLTTE